MARIRTHMSNKIQELLELGRRVDSSMAESPHFAESPQPLATARANVAAGTEKLQIAESEARVGGTPKKIYRDKVKKEYVQSLKTLVRQVEAFADGDLNILRSSGFDVLEDVPRKTRHTAGLRVPICTVVPGTTTGTALATWKAVSLALSIEAHLTEGDPTVAENWRHYGFFPPTSHIELTGLPTGRNCSLRFRALNGTEAGPWSPIHTLTPP